MSLKNKRQEHDPISASQNDTIKSLVSGLRHRYSFNPNIDDISSLNDDEMRALTSISSFSFPSLNLFQSSTSDKSILKNSTANHSQFPLNARKKAAQNLAQSVLYVDSEIKEVPSTITKNLLHCFTSIIDANLFQYLKRNVYNKSKNFPVEHKALKLLSSTFCNNNSCSQYNVDDFTPIKLKSGATSFDIPSNFQVKSDMFSAPLTVKIVFVLRLKGKFIKVEMSCGGKIAGIFNSVERKRLDCIDLRLNTSELLTLLRQEARKIILKAINLGRDSDLAILKSIASKVDTQSYCSPRLIPAATKNSDLLHVSLVENVNNNETSKRKSLLMNKSLILHKRAKTIESHKEVQLSTFETLLMVASRLRKSEQ